ncbi:Tryptophan/tyrosine permease, partial [Ochromonadaceae sp. CCMP2298]
LASAVALVSGTSVGAGIIALATVSAQPGFLPSSGALLFSWALMCSTGLLIAENRGQRRGGGSHSSHALGIVSSTHRLLGRPAAAAAALFYAFIHYALLTAYIAEAGAILGAHLPHPLAPLLFTFVLGGAMALGSDSFVRRLNDLFFLSVLATFCALLGMGLGQVRASSLLYHDAAKLGPIFPTLLVALVFHNVVPSVCCSLRFHRPSVCLAVLLGSLLPLCMFLLWNALVLGLIPIEDCGGKAVDPLALLMSAMPPARRGASRALIGLFSVAAIVTSFIGFVIGLMEFLGDLLPLRPRRDPLLYLLALAPPLLAALLDPDIFLGALDAAGTFGISILFGALPALLALKLRGLAAQG